MSNQCYLVWNEDGLLSCTVSHSDYSKCDLYNASEFNVGNNIINTGEYEVTATKIEDNPFSETGSKIVEDIWFAARRGEGDMRPYEARLDQYTQRLVLEGKIAEAQNEINLLLKDYKTTDDYNLKIAANRMEQRKAELQSQLDKLNGDRES